MSRNPLILASASPRRRELLAKMGVTFQVQSAGITEWHSGTAPELSVSEMALANARLKASHVAGKNPERWVLGVDTMVALENRIFGKPGTIAEAKSFLRALSGCTHRVITGCVLIDSDGSEDSFVEETQVAFQKLTDLIIDRYLATVQVLDKAGAYALQEHPEMIIAKVEGSPSNVIGLPMEKLAALFHLHGFI